MCSLPPFSLLAPPYGALLPLADEEDFPRNPRAFRGAALVWNLAEGGTPAHLERAAERPGGMPLLILLPPAVVIPRLQRRMLAVVEETRPQAVLPHHPVPDPHELRYLLAQGPASLEGDVVDYLWWRGLTLDGEMRRLVTRMLQLSGEVRTVSAVARSVYLSRRALGRRFHDRGLPAPSRWLQVFRLLRAAILLQGTDLSLAEIARTLSYPDGFTLSNQMERLVGVRPSLARERLGWEWFFESWLWTEWERGGLRRPLRGMAPHSRLPDRGTDTHVASDENRTGAERSGEAA